MQPVLSVFILSLILSSAVAWVGLSPRPIEPFFALATLGEGMKAERYYPGNSSNIAVGTPIQWYVTIYNHMGTAQYVLLRVKLLNQTMIPPDPRNNIPSPAPAFIEFWRVLAHNETWVFSFRWLLANVSFAVDSLIVNRLVVNDISVDEGLGVRALNGYNFRIVLELWIHNVDTGQFEFYWSSGRERRSAWNQIWFNVTGPVL